MAEIVVERVSKMFGGGVTAVDDISILIAMVFQSYALHPHMTVRQNLG